MKNILTNEWNDNLTKHGVCKLQLSTPNPHDSYFKFIIQSFTQHGPSAVRSDVCVNEFYYGSVYTLNSREQA